MNRNTFKARKKFTVLMLIGLLFIATTSIGMRMRINAAEPWDYNAQGPELSVKNDLQKGKKYFTNKEWTGEISSADIDGRPVRQSDIFQVNREEAHAEDTLPYQTVEAAKQGAKDFAPENSDYYQLLTKPTDNWDLTVFKNLTDANSANVTKNFYKTDFDVSANPYVGTNRPEPSQTANYGCGWKSVTLPASWQAQGFDFPIYTNITMPWNNGYGNSAAVIPLAPTVFNPVGFYRHSFDVPTAWSGQKVYITFEGVESCMYLYVNGYEVGYTENSHDSHDFDITPFLNTDGKENLIAVRVHRWSSGSWLEDQDSINMGGIFRDVFVYAKPPVHIRDYKVETPLVQNYTAANLDLNIDVRNMSLQDADGYGLDVKLFDAVGQDIFASNPLRSDISPVASGKENAVSLKRLVESPKLWSAETPYLYTMVLTLYHKGTGQHVESVSQQIGFREIGFVKTNVDADFNKIATEYKDITINGQPLVFKGVNRQDNYAKTGKYVSKALYEKDIKLMK